MIQTANLSGMTVASVIKNNKGMTTGFDYLRIVLAVSVLLYHSTAAVSGNFDVVVNSIFLPFPRLILPMFFCLSGFLVAGSLQRTAGIKVFLLLRAVRIVPALFVEVLLSALILGPLLTTVPLSEYFTDHSFYAYFLNILGDIHFHLPGMFLTNPFPDVVNGSLWTLPAELACYVTLSVLAVLKIIQYPRILLSVGLAGIIVSTVAVLLPVADYHSHILDWAAHSSRSRPLVFAFIAGVTFYFYQDKIPYSGKLFALATGIALVTLLFNQTVYLAIPFVGYMTVYLGLQNPPKKTFLLRGDYSYGLYLFAGPLQQTHAYLFAPNLTWLGNVAFALFFGILYAYFSWNVIEKPILMKKNAIIARIDKMTAVVWPFGAKPTLEQNRSS